MPKRGRPRCAAKARAIAEGQRFYQNGKPCPNGHGDDPLRYTKQDGRCVECVKAQVRDWQRTNPERVRLHTRKWEAKRGLAPWGQRKLAYLTRLPSYAEAFPTE